MMELGQDVIHLLCNKKKQTLSTVNEMYSLNLVPSLYVYIAVINYLTVYK